MPTSPKIFQKVNQAIIDDIKSELRLQGHYLTGALEASLQPREELEGNDIILTAQALGYLESLEKGIPASQIKMDTSSIAEMTKYVTLRMGYRGNYATKVAISILKKQIKEGNPTDNSYNFSKTGERKFAVEDTFYNNQPRYTGMMDDVAYGGLDDQFNKVKSGTI